MKILRTSNPDAAIALLPMYVCFNQTREEIAEELFARLCNDSDNTLVITVVDDDTNIKFFSASYVRDDEVFIWQARGDKSLEKKWPDICLGLIMGWAKKKGIEQITAVPNRNPKVYQRRWGFELKDNRLIKKIEV